MNRNVIYNYLKSIGMYPIIRYTKNRQSYHIEFVVDNDGIYYNAIDVGWGYIQGFGAIKLFKDGVRIISKYEDMEVHIDYADMKKFEVKLFEECE